MKHTFWCDYRPLSRESQRFSKHLDPIRRLWLASSADVCRHENIPWVAGICSWSAAAITPHWCITHMCSRFIQCRCADVGTYGCACLFVCLSTCHHSYIKITPLWRITEWQKINLMSPLNTCCILMWNMWTPSVSVAHYSHIWKYL